MEEGESKEIARHEFERLEASYEETVESDTDHLHEKNKKK